MFVGVDVEPMIAPFSCPIRPRTFSLLVHLIEHRHRVRHAREWCQRGNGLADRRIVPRQQPGIIPPFPHGRAPPVDGFPGTVALLAGGTGGAKLAAGAQELLGSDLSVIANTGDDIEILGVHVSVPHHVHEPVDAGLQQILGVGQR